MTRRNRLNLVLVVAITGIASLIWLMPAPSRAPAAGTLMTAAPATVEVINVARAGRPSMTFRRDQDGRWMITAPFSAPAHPRRMAEILAVPRLPILAELDVTRPEWRRYGLDPAAVTLAIDDVLIGFGTTDAIDGRRYVLYQDRVLLVPERVVVPMQQDPAFFIDPALLRAGLVAERIATPTREVARVGGHWEDVRGNGPPTADELAATWIETEASAVHIGLDEEVGLPVTVTLAGGRVATFEQFSRGAALELWRRDLGLRYVLDASVATRLGLEVSAPPGIGETP